MPLLSSFGGGSARGFGVGIGGGGFDGPAWELSSLSVGGTTPSSGTQNSIDYLKWPSSGDGYLDVEPGGNIYGIMVGATGGEAMSWGGDGGKSFFHMVVPSGVTRIWISVGGGGQAASGANGGTISTGYNGGGASDSRDLPGANFYPSYSKESAGGGYTGLFQGGSSVTKNHTNALLVVGGGGGGSTDNNTDRNGSGGWGGGIDQDGRWVQDVPYMIANYGLSSKSGSRINDAAFNGTTTAGGGHWQSPNAPSPQYYTLADHTDGSALQGGRGETSDLDGGSGGGGGWYGGGGGRGGGGYSHGAGGGGSGKSNIGADLISNSNQDTNSLVKTAAGNYITASGLSSYSSSQIYTDLAFIHNNNSNTAFALSAGYGNGQDGYVILFNPK